MTADSYTSDAIVADHTRSTYGKYSGRDSIQFKRDILRDQRAGDGTGVHRVADDTNTDTGEAGITFCEIDGYIDGFENGVHADTTGDGWINGNYFPVTLCFAVSGSTWFNIRDATKFSPST